MAINPFPLHNTLHGELPSPCNRIPSHAIASLHTFEKVIAIAMTCHRMPFPQCMQREHTSRSRWDVFACHCMNAGVRKGHCDCDGMPRLAIIALHSWERAILLKIACHSMPLHAIASLRAWGRAIANAIASYRMTLHHWIRWQKPLQSRCHTILCHCIIACGGKRYSNRKKMPSHAIESLHAWVGAIAIAIECHLMPLHPCMLLFLFLLLLFYSAMDNNRILFLFIIV